MKTLKLKTVSELSSEMSMLLNNSKNDKSYERIRSKYNLLMLYIETNPCLGNVTSEINRIERFINITLSRFDEWLKSKPKECANKTPKECLLIYNSKFEVTKAKSQLKNLKILIK